MGSQGGKGPQGGKGLEDQVGDAEAGGPTFACG